MTKIKILTTRTSLRLIEVYDLEAIHNLHVFPETDKYNALGIPQNIKETKSIIEPWIEAHRVNEIKNFTFKIKTHVNEEFIGLFGLKVGNKKYNRAEVWYKIHPDYWSQGYATEALKAVINFGFDTLKLHRIEAGCAVDNVGSFKVMEKAGMIREGRGRQVLPLKSGWSDNYEYAMLETDKRERD
ncbi:GNAT family N-acetyltransferase [Lacinutrix neustonica]|uniref:GNAT family N-acetyltransferase n=1 Tax=Lacinutrix neustonica TaxID=2980107 RepID=A0A9E8MVN9_9FLAO|nr:GNAT family N-acetyltransferase [Lacinutrix neustonica]WAC02348.1 GNAT family N-acetyltransferase [Lacinutrix neustonica]